MNKRFLILILLLFLIPISSSTILKSSSFSSYYFLSNQKEKTLKKDNFENEDKENSESKKENNKYNEKYQSDEEKLRRLNNIGLIINFFVLFVLFFAMVTYDSWKENWKPSGINGPFVIDYKFVTPFCIFILNIIATLFLEFAVSPYIIMLLKDGKSFLKNIKNKFRLNYFFILIGWIIFFPVFIFFLLLFFEKVFAKKGEEYSKEKK